MKIAVMGSGGVGGYFGGRLAAAGFDVTFIARGEHLAVIHRDGLKIESENGDVHISPAQATDNPADVGLVDCVLFTVKLWDTAAAAAAIRPMIDTHTAVLSLQNGVNAEHQLSALLGRSHVMGGIAQIAAVIAAPGIIRHTGTIAKLMFGELNGERSQRSEDLLAALQAAGVNAEISQDIEKTVWRKFVFLVGLSALTSVTGHSIGRVRQDPHTRDLLVTVMRESVAVAYAKDIVVGDQYVEDCLALIDTLPADMTSSMQQDLKRGNRLELDWLSGAVLRMGQELGVDTPVNGFIYAALKLNKNGTD